MKNCLFLAKTRFSLVSILKFNIFAALDNWKKEVFMKKLFTLLAVAMLAIVNANAQTISNPTGWVDPPENWEDYVVDLFIWGQGEAATKIPDTIWYEDFGGPEYNGYLPIIIEYPGIAEFYDISSRETVGYSTKIRVNDVCCLSAIVAGTNWEEAYGGITVDKACTRPPQMVPFTDTLFVEEGKKEILKPWHWVPYEETYIRPYGWIKDGEYVDDYWGMSRVDIYGPTEGDTVIYEVQVCDNRLSYEITNTFVVIGTEKSNFGVDEAVTSPINVYPNPSNNGIITIKGEGIAEIFNILGQKVRDVEVLNETKVSLSSGLYIVRMGGHSEKVFVE